jgi:hypothetical protein
VKAEKETEVSFYVHSELSNDLAIVYDNQRRSNGLSYEDKYVRVKSGMAHLCNEPFASWHPWGSWRRGREFVGRVEYACRLLLWNPEVHCKFSSSFKDGVMVFLLARPRAGCPLSFMSDDIIFYILNMVRQDWILPERSRTGRLHSAASSLLTQVSGSNFSKRLSTAIRQAASFLGFDEAA